MDYCNIECLSTRVGDGSLSLDFRLEAAVLITDLAASGLSIGGVVEKNLHDSLSQPELNINLMAAVSRALLEGNIRLTEATLLRMSSMLGSHEIDLKLKTNLAAVLERAIATSSPSHEVNGQVIYELTTCALKHSKTPLKTACITALAHIGETVQMTPNFWFRLEKALHSRDTSESASNITAAYSIQPNHKLPLKLLVIIAQTVHSKASNEAKINAAITLLQSLAHKSKDFQDHLDEALASAGSKARLFRIIVESIKLVSKTDQAHLVAGRILPFLESLLDFHESLPHVIELLKKLVKHEVALPESMLLKLSSMMIHKVRMDMLSQSIVSVLYDSLKQRTYENIHDIVQNLVSALSFSEMVAEIFMHLSSRIKFHANIMELIEEHFEKSVNNEEMIYVYSVVLGYQVNKHGLILKDDTVTEVTKLVASKVLSGTILGNLIVILNSCTLSHSAQQLTAHSLSRIVGNQAYTVEVRIQAASLMFKWLNEAKDCYSFEAFDNLNAAIADIEHADLKNIILLTLGLSAKLCSHKPSIALLDSFELLMTHSDYVLFGLYGVLAILEFNNHASLRAESVSICMALLLGERHIGKHTDALISTLSLHHAHIKSHFDMQVLGALKLILHGNKLFSALFIAFKVHAENGGKLDDGTLQALITYPNKVQVLLLLEAQSQNEPIKSPKALALLKHFLIDGNYEDEHRNIALAILSRSEASTPIPGLRLPTSSFEQPSSTSFRSSTLHTGGARSEPSRLETESVPRKTKGIDLDQDLLTNLLSIGWPLNSVLKLIKTVAPENLDKFIEVMLVIGEYGISDTAQNKAKQTVAQILHHEDSINWYSAVIQLATDYYPDIYGESKGTTTLLKELYATNKHNPDASDAVEMLIEIQEFTDGKRKSSIADAKRLRNLTSRLNASSPTTSENTQHADVLFSQLLSRERQLNIARHAQNLQNKSITQWSANDIFLWTSLLTPEDIEINFAEVLSVISRAAFIAHGYYLRTAQIIAAFIAYNADEGRIMQVATGEGKSVLFATLAIIKALENYPVDIMTSSPLLARRDAEEQTDFISMFGLTVDHNIKHKDRSERTRVACYESNIVIGDIATYIADRLSQEYHKYHTRGTRRYGFALVDEVDNMLIDNSKHVVRLAQSISGFEHLEVVLVAVWNQLCKLNENLDDKGMYHLGSQTIRIDDDLRISILTAFISEIVSSTHSGIVIPQHLKDFVTRSATEWSKSAITASHYKMNVNYVISESDGITKIMPVDYRSTGVIQSNMHWNNGLHQFLQIKHGLKIAPESLSIVYMSNIGFFKLYGKNLIGMTGTIGAESEQQLLNQIYGVDFIRMPTYKKKRFVQWPTRFARTTEQWLISIKDSVLNEVLRGRAVLIISETIIEVKLIAQWLEHTIQSIKVSTYTQGNEGVMQEVVSSGDVIVATNLAGRGTDLKTKEVLEKRGGLHVIVSYLPVNLRVELQAFGRTSRQGLSGTAQLIVNAYSELTKLQNLASWYVPNSEHSLKQTIINWRNAAESERLKVDRLISTEIMLLQDEIFSSFMAFTHQLHSTKAATDIEIAQLGELFGQWREEWEKLIMNATEITTRIADSDLLEIQNRNRKLAQAMRTSLDGFIAQQNASLTAGTLIVNPAYYVKRGLRDSNIQDLDRAIALDPSYSYIAHYNKARMYISNGPLKLSADKQAVHEMLDAASLNLRDMIERLRSMHLMLGLCNIQMNESPLALQTQRKIEILTTHLQYCESVSNFIKASRSDETVIIGTPSRLGDHSVQRLVDLFPYDSDEVEELDNAGLNSFFHIYKHVESNEDSSSDGWFGSLFLATFGVLQAALQTVLINLEGQLHSMNFETVMEHVQGVLNSVVSFAVGNSVDTIQLWQAKGISHAINCAVLGKLIELQTICKHIYPNDACPSVDTSQPSKLNKIARVLRLGLMSQNVTKPLSLVGHAIGSEMLHTLQSEIEDEISKKFTRLADDLKIELDKVLAPDARDHGTEQRKQLYELVLHLLHKSQAAYNEVGLQIAESIGNKLVPSESTPFSFAEPVEWVLALVRNFSDTFANSVRYIAKSLPASHVDTRESVDKLSDYIFNRTTRMIMWSIRGELINSHTAHGTTFGMNKYFSNLEAARKTVKEDIHALHKRAQKNSRRSANTTADMRSNGVEYSYEIRQKDISTRGIVYLTLKDEYYLDVTINNTLGASKIFFNVQASTLSITGDLKVTGPALEFIEFDGTFLEDVIFFNCQISGVNSVITHATELSINNISVLNEEPITFSWKAIEFESHIFVGNITATSGISFYAKNITIQAETNVAAQSIDMHGAINQYGRLEAINAFIYGSYNLHPAGNTYAHQTFSVNGTQLIQSGNITANSALLVNCAQVKFLNTTSLTLGSIHIESENLERDGLLHAIAGNLTIIHKGRKKDLHWNNIHPLKALRVTLIVPGTCNNLNQIVANEIEVSADSFHNYKYINVNGASLFNLKNMFYNHGEANFGPLVLQSSTSGSQINKVINEGRIQSGNTQVNAKVTENLATGFTKRWIEQCRWKNGLFIGGRCSIANLNNWFDGTGGWWSGCFCTGVEEIVGTLSEATWRSDNLQFFEGTFLTQSSNLYVQGKLYLNNTALKVEDHKLSRWAASYFYVHENARLRTQMEHESMVAQYGGSVRTIDRSDGQNKAHGSSCFNHKPGWHCGGTATNKLSPGVTRVFNSKIHAVQGVEGSLLSLEIVSQGEFSEFPASSAVALYDFTARDALMQVAEIQRRIFITYQAQMRAAILSGAFTLDISPKAGASESFLFKLSENVNAPPSYRGIVYMMERDANSMMPTPNNAMVVHGAPPWTDWLLSQTHLTQLFVLGDSHYLQRLIEDQVFKNIGVIAGMDNAQLAEILIEAAMFESEQAAHRGDPFKLGEPLSISQQQALSKPIAWFLFKDNCFQTGTRCLYPRIYFTQASIQNFMSETLSSEGTIMLKVTGNTLLGSASSIRGKDIQLQVDGDVISFAKITSDGSATIQSQGGVFIGNDVKTTGDLAIEAVDIAVVNKIRVGGNLTLAAAENIAIQTLVSVLEYGENVVSRVVLEADVEAAGSVSISTQNQNVGIIGARIAGASVYIKAGNKVISVPIELYQRAITRTKKYYSDYQSLTYHTSRIEALSAGTYDIKNNVARFSSDVAKHGGAVGLVVIGGQGILWDSTDATTDKQAQFIAPDGGVEITNRVEFELRYTRSVKSRGGPAGWAGGKKTTETREYRAQSLDTKITAASVEVIASDSITIGADIIAHTVQFNRNGASRNGLINIVPRVQEYSYEVRTKKTGLLFEKSKSGRFMFAGSRTKGYSHHEVEVIPTVIGLVQTFGNSTDAPKFIVSTPHGLRIISSRIEEWQDESGKVVEVSERTSVVVIDATDLELLSVPNMESTLAFVDETGVGIGFKSDSSEVSVSIGLSKYTQSNSQTKFTHENLPALLAGLIYVNATNAIRDMNAVYNAQQMNLHARIIFHGVAEDKVTEKAVTKLMEGGAKLGIKWGSLGRMIDGANRMSDQELDRPEGWINAGFAGLQIYHNMLKLLSGAGGISAGAWGFAHYSSQRRKSTTTQERPTVIQILGELNITADEWQLIGTQIEAYRGYIQTKYLKSEPAKLSRTYEQKHESFDVEIPLAGNTGNGISGAFGRAEGHASLMMNARIHIHEHLQLEVSGTANMRGIHVSARSLEAFFDELLLESIQDIEHHSEYGAGLGLSSADISSVSGNVGKRNKHMVSEITALIGSEKATIVVAKALRLNGAMIAAAHRAEDGSYSEHGLLTLRVGEFFVQHIHDYDEGYTLGAALGSDFLSPTFGGHKISGTTFGTVGEGSIECTKAGGACETAFARRDVTKPQERDTEYDIKPITLYVPLGPMPSLPRTPDGQLDWRQMSDNLHAQTFGTIAALAKLVGKPFELTNKPDIQNPNAQELDKKAEQLKKAYEKLTSEDKQDVEQTFEEVAQLNHAISQAVEEPIDSKAQGLLHGKFKWLADKVDKFDEYAAENPGKAELILLALTALPQGLKHGATGARAGRLAGLWSMIAGGLGGFLFGSGKAIASGASITSQQMSMIMEEGSKQFAPLLLKLDPTISERQAIILGCMTIALATLSASQLKPFMKIVRSYSDRTAAGSTRPDSMFMHDTVLKSSKTTTSARVDTPFVHGPLTPQQQSSKPIAQTPKHNVPENIVSKEAHKIELRAQMSEPYVVDSQLKAIMKDLYKPGSKVGSGSTAAALREELITVQPVGGKFHTIKTVQYITTLEKWLKNNPTGSLGDRAAAENVLKDLQNVLEMRN